MKLDKKSSEELEVGRAEDLEAVKKARRQEYMREYKRKRRKDQPEVAISLSLADREKLQVIASRLEMNLGSLLRLAALAYLNKTYLVPKPDQVAQLEQQISLIMSDTRRLARRAERDGYTELYWGYKLLVQKYESLAQHVSQLQREPQTLARNNKS